MNKPLAALFIAITIAALAGCGRSDGADKKADAAKAGPPPAAQVSVAAAVEREVREWDEFSGRLEAVETVEVRSRVSGVVNGVHFQAGREAKRGELLFTIDPRPFQAELARAEAELARAITRSDLARTELARAEKLLSAKAISQQEYDERVSGNREGDASIRAARAAVDVAKLNLEFTRVTAAISGRLSRAEVTPGNWVNGGNVGATLLTTIVSVDPIYAYFEGDEQVYLKYQDLAAAGQRASSRESRNPILMGLANEDGFPHRGHMDFVDNRLDPKTGTIRVRAVFDNKDRRLTPGLFARLRLVGSGTYKAVLVTDRAIGTDQNQKFVFAVGADNMLQYRPVKLGALIDGMRVIKEGLKPGEVIVVNGLQRVRPGMPVTPQMVSMEANPPAPGAPAAAGDAKAKSAKTGAATEADRKTSADMKADEATKAAAAPKQ
jgi:RND family efflux transporter MFP subunit